MIYKIIRERTSYISNSHYIDLLLVPFKIRVFSFSFPSCGPAKKQTTEMCVMRDYPPFCIDLLSRYETP